mmetsp:Transcript_25696/g.50299  ORF Transcript_25696/g.50299 Transcript_25696/m.50299 type:complete len:87 (+) Transcript_25696:847-1107(+)
MLLYEREDDQLNKALPKRSTGTAEKTSHMGASRLLVSLFHLFVQLRLVLLSVPSASASTQAHAIPPFFHLVTAVSMRVQPTGRLVS